MEIIRGNDLDKALESAYRVYLCGDLKKPQDLKWIHDENVEMGISYYKEFTADQPHYHLHATEYNFILEGKSKFLLVDVKLRRGRVLYERVALGNHAQRVEHVCVEHALELRVEPRSVGDVELLPELSVFVEKLPGNGNAPHASKLEKHALEEWAEIFALQVC